MRKTLFTVILTVAVALCSVARTWTVDDLSNPQEQRIPSFVANPDNILSPGIVNQINQIVDNVYQTSGAEVAVVVVDDIDTDIDTWATTLFDRWSIGKEGANTGVLFVVAKTSRKYAIRTGRGITAVLPDVTAHRIARSALIPRLKAGDFDGGVLDGVSQICNILNEPRAVEQIKAAHDREKQTKKTSILDILIFYVWCSIGLTVLLFIWFIYRTHKTAGLERHTRYEELYPMLRILYGLCFVGLGIPLLVYIPAKKYLHNLRDGRHDCPNCGTRMNKVDELHDNDYLTPAQDAEERFNSVDYDVWLCPNCGETDIYAFENRDSPMMECSHCHARTARYLRDRVIQRPTRSTEGIAVKEFDCLNCHRITQIPYKLPKLPPPGAGGAAAAGLAAGIFLGGLGGRGGGGGFGGGGFGGGTTGGSGTSGGW